MRTDPYQARARELAAEAGFDPDGRIERPGQRASRRNFEGAAHLAAVRGRDGW